MKFFTKNKEDVFPFSFAPAFPSLNHKMPGQQYSQGSAEPVRGRNRSEERERSEEEVASSSVGVLDGRVTAGHSTVAFFHT